MFGYIAPRLDQLSEEQKKRYRAYYCGLCRALGTQSGKSGRLLLSHDMTFLSILLNSLMEPGEKPDSIRCGLHPAKKKEILVSPAIDYAAALNIILMDFKCEDQILDDHSGMGRLERKMLEGSVKSLQQEYPTQYEEIRKALQALWQEEKEADPDPDRLCNLSGRMLGAAFVPPWADAFWAGSLRGLGEGLGRFIYWMDAWDDLKKDLRKGHFNPLRRWESQEDLETFVKDVLEMLIGEATEYFEALPLEKDLDLLRNVLYSGVWQRYDMMKLRAEKGRKKA